MGKVADFQRSQSFDHLIDVTGVGSNPALATFETSHVLLAGVSGGFRGVLHNKSYHVCIVMVVLHIYHKMFGIR